MNAQRLSPATLATVLLFLTMFFLTLWRFGANQCLALVVVLVLIYRPWREQLCSWQHFKKPIILWSLLFILWALISLSYSQAPCLTKAAQGLTMYSKLLFLLVLPLAMRGLKCRYWIEQGLISGVFINVVLSTLYYFHVGFIVAHLGSHFAINMTFAINPLQMIFVVAFACWILLQRLLNKEAHWTDISLFIVLTLYLWLINIERSGYLLYLVMIILALYQVLHKKGFILGLLFIPILLIGLYEFSANVKTRIDIGIANIQAFEQAQTLQELQTTNSLGLRMAFFMQSLAVIKAHPLLGTGIGSFKYVYTKMGGPSAAGLTDTHNAYTMVAFELGLIGLFIYLAWLFSIFKVINKLAPLTAHRLRGLWWMFVVMGFTDSGLVLNAVGLSFIMGISLYAHEQLTG